MIGSSASKARFRPEENVSSTCSVVSARRDSPTSSKSELGARIGRLFPRFLLDMIRPQRPTLALYMYWLTVPVAHFHVIQAIILIGQLE